VASLSACGGTAVSHARRAREGRGEALIGECVGQPLSGENQLRGANVLRPAEGNTARVVVERQASAPRRRRTWHAQTPCAREPADFCCHDGIGTPDCIAFAAHSLAYTLPCQRFVCSLAAHRHDSGPAMDLEIPTRGARSAPVYDRQCPRQQPTPRNKACSSAALMRCYLCCSAA
jgi:hypothetical protein